MPETRPRPERIDLSQADDIRDVVHRAVACLATGGIAALPTETGFAIAASALHPEAVSRLIAAARAVAPHPDTPHRSVLLLRGETEAVDWAPGLSQLAGRFVQRAWPGPIALALPVGKNAGLATQLAEPVRNALIANDSIALRVPANGLLREIMRLTPGPLIAIDLTDAAKAAGGYERLASEEAAIDLIVDQGHTRDDQPATIVEVRDNAWQIVAPGAASRGDIASMAGNLWLFICTGNTCRSPMAEALCKVTLAKRLGCTIDELAERGYVIMSAGVYALSLIHI